MTLAYLHDFLLWCLTINYGILLLWFLVFLLARDWMFKIHTKWFAIPADRFDSIHYSLIGLYKIGILLFNLVPFIAVYSLGNGG